MQAILKNAMKTLEIYLDPVSEDWERDYAAKMIGKLESGRQALLATVRNPTADGMLK